LGVGVGEVLSKFLLVGENFKYGFFWKGTIQQKKL